MRGTLYPSANVIFSAQQQNPADVPISDYAATATDLLASAYGKWEAVENSGLAIAEEASLLNDPERKCSNGRSVPVSNPDWNRFVKELREAGGKVYYAAQSRNMDSMVTVAETVSGACLHCHQEFRDTPKGRERCR
jgi:hypothetical protein